VRLLLDENCSSRELLARLRAGGHDVVASIAVLGSGASEDAIVSHAHHDRRAIVTKDAHDFRAAVSNTPEHPGLLLVFDDSHAPRLLAAALSTAIDNIATAYRTVRGLILSVNEFQY